MQYGEAGLPEKHIVDLFLDTLVSKIKIFSSFMDRYTKSERSGSSSCIRNFR